MSKWVFLSHLMDENTPVYGAGEGFRSEVIKSIDKGDSCNTARWTIPNHLSTHIDFPRHFTEEGKSLSNYEPGFWIFKSVRLIDISPVLPTERVSYEKLIVDEMPPDTELLLVKTGFQKLRNNPSYAKEGPVFDPQIAGELRRLCPKIRIIGLDAISLSSFHNRELGRAAHAAFLSNEQPILIIEDMDMSMVDSDTEFQSVVISPLLVRNADGSPCSILAEVF